MMTTPELNRYRMESESTKRIHDNGPQLISDGFEHLSHRLDIKHIKTVTYPPQANLTERVNRTLVQMIACFVEENHDNWDRFLHEFSFALRTSVNETTGPSHQLYIRQCNPHTEESRQGARVQYDSARETRTTPSKGHSAAEGRPVRSRQTTSVRPCPYYLRSRLKESEGIPEE
ncbi:uncharacterized protein TNCV_4233541 [Trichonephila clavipes]|nr:uncharacterized protein TNCV_4233541 [Trichonephila clavipes]